MIPLYVVAGLAVIWGVSHVTRRHRESRIRRVLISLLAGLMFAPSVIGGGHGYAFGPAWYAGYQQVTMEGGSSYGLLVLGVAPVVAFTVVCLLAREAWVLIRRRRSGGAG